MGLVQKIGRGMFWNFVGKATIAVVGLLTSVLIVRLLGPDQYGLWIIILTVSSLSLAFSSFGLESGINKFVPEFRAEKEDKKAHKTINMALLTRSLILLFISITLCLSARLISNYLLRRPQTLFYIRIVPLLMIPLGLSGILTSFLNALYEQKFLNLLRMFTSSVNFIGILILYLMKVGILAILCLTVLVNIITLIFLFMKARKEISFGNFKEDISRVVKYCRTMWLAGLGDSLLGKRQDLFLLGVFGALRDAGGYDIAFTLPYTMRVLLINSVFEGVGLASLSELVGKKDYFNFKKGVELLRKYIYLIIFPLAIGGCLLGNSIVRVIYGAEYLYMVLPLQMFFLVPIAATLFGPTSLTLASLGEEKYILRSKMIGIVNLGLNLLLIPKHGMIGALIGTSVSWFFMGAYEYYVITKVVQIPLSFPIKFIFKILLAAIIMGTSIYSFRAQESLVGILYVSCFGVIIYTFGLRLFKIFDMEDIETLRRTRIPLSRYFIRALGYAYK